MDSSTGATGMDDKGTSRISAAVARELPPLLNIEHQELIRAVERVQVQVMADRDYLECKIQDLGGKLDERYAMQTKALDAAFMAQTTAMDAAFAAQEKAIDKAFAAQQNAVEAALAARERALDLALAARDKAVDAEFAAQEKAVTKAETANEKRFESVNEFRAQLGDIISTMIPRTEANARIGAIEDKIADLKAVVDKGLGRSKAGMENWGVLVGGVGMIVAIATLLIIMFN